MKQKTPKMIKVIMQKIGGVWHITFVDITGCKHYRITSNETVKETCRHNPGMYDAYLRCVNSAHDTITLYYSTRGQVVARVA